MTAPVTVPTTVEELAAGIAADIRAHGHYQGRASGISFIGGGSGGCCIRFSPSWREVQQREIVDELESILVDDPNGKVFGTLGPKIVDWNDNTPTVEVLAVLDRIAAGLNWREQGLDPNIHDRCPECQVGLIVTVGSPEYDTGHQYVACTECGFTS